MKTIIRILLPLLLLLCFVCTVSADESSVTWHGIDKGFTFAPGTEYSSTDLFDDFKNVMPGDTLTEKVTVSNRTAGTDYLKVYIRAEIPDDPQTQEFLSGLTMTVTSDGKEIHNALPDENIGFTEPILLEELAPNESLTLDVTLLVPITLDNQFSGLKIGEVHWIFIVEAFDAPTPPPVVKQQLTVRKVWDDDGIDRPEQVTVALLRDGTVAETVVLNQENQWIYSWGQLDEDSVWTVEEVGVPDGYSVSYNTVGSTVTILNKKDQILPPSPPSPPIITTESITVIKEWDDDGSIRPQSVEIALLRNGVTAETVILNEDNAWRYTWSTLAADAVWTVSEPVVPKDYVVTYRTEGNTVTVINKQILDEINPQDPLDVPDKISLTVVKTWDDAHYPDAKRPEGVKMTLYNGEEAVESVWLGAWNHWTFTWSDLDSKGEWSVMEEPVEGYTPYYSVSGDTVTVTNTAILLQTGQLKWPIPVIAGCGLLLIGIGILLLSSKKEKNHAS